MDNKIALKYIAIIVFLGIIAFSAYKSYDEGKKAEEQKTIEEQKQTEEQEKNEEPEENPPELERNEYIILTRETYSDAYKTTIRLYSNGKLEQSTIKEETIASDKNEEKFINIGNIKEEDLKTIQETIAIMATEKFKRDSFSNSYGISIRITEKNDVLYSAEYFDQDNVNILYNIIKEY